MKITANWSVQFFGFILMLGFWGSNCQRQVPVDDIEHPPLFTAKDTVYQDVYQPLDGTWKGVFQIFQDTVNRPRDEQKLGQVNKALLNTLPLKRLDTILVTQVYESESPYFQKVSITDYYPNQDKTVESFGVNKVQDGKMWCIVRKPDETVIHQGATLPPETIIWQRNIQAPAQRIEYFKETVLENNYYIIGYGYYDGDDPKMMPKLWFYAAYEKQ